MALFRLLPWSCTRAHIGVPQGVGSMWRKFLPRWSTSFPSSQIFPPFACSRQIDPLFHVGTPFIHSFPPLPNFPPFLRAYAIFIRFSTFLPRSSTSFPSSQNFPPFSPCTHLVGTCATRGYNYPHGEHRCSSRRSGYRLQTNYKEGWVMFRV